MDAGIEHEVTLRFSRWAKARMDRVYVSEVLPGGDVRDLGNYDIGQRRWFTKGTTRDLSRERQDATKALVLLFVRQLGSGGSQ